MHEAKCEDFASRHQSGSLDRNCTIYIITGVDNSNDRASCVQLLPLKSIEPISACSRIGETNISAALPSRSRKVFLHHLGEFPRVRVANLDDVGLPVSRRTACPRTLEIGDGRTVPIGMKEFEIVGLLAEQHHCPYGEQTCRQQSGCLQCLHIAPNTANAPFVPSEVSLVQAAGSGPSKI